MTTSTISYRASSNLTVTNLQSCATSAAWTSGWISETIDNTSDMDIDKVITGKIALGNSAVAGELRLYAFAQLDDSNYPALLSAGTAGTEGTATVTTTTIRDATMVLLATLITRADPGTDDVYNFPPLSLRAAFNGYLPPRVVLFFTHSTGVNLASSGNQITVKGVTEASA